MSGWVEEMQAMSLSESQDLWWWLPQGHPGASRLTSSLPVSAELFPPHLLSLSHIFHLSLTDNEVYKCCLVSGICLEHQNVFPAVNGGALTQFRQGLFACYGLLACTAPGSPPDSLSAVRLLILCGKRNEETSDRDKINCAGNLKSLLLSARTKW